MPSIQSALSEFIAAQRADGSRVTTITWYQSLLKPFAAALGREPVDQVTAHDIRAYINGLADKDYGEETIKGHRRALHKFWAWVSVEYEIKNPMRNIAYPKPPRANPQPARWEDVIALFVHAGEGIIGIRNRAIMALLLDTGCRRAELSQLNLSDVQMQTNSIMVMRGKGNKIRAVKFTDYSHEILSEWLSVRQPEIDALFYDLDTWERLLPNGVGQMLKRIARRAGVQGRISAHRWRDLFATQYVLNGGDLVTLSKLLGHKSINTTVDHYIAFTDQQISRAHNKYSPMKKLASEIRKQKLKELKRHEQDHSEGGKDRRAGDQYPARN